MSETKSYPAAFTVHWPNGPVHCCAHHRVGLVGLAALLGSHVGVTLAPDGAQCSNCINEAAMSTKVA